MGDDSRHTTNVFEEGEFDHELTVAEFAAVQSEGPRRVERRIERYDPGAITKAEKSKMSPEFKGDTGQEQDVDR